MKRNVTIFSVCFLRLVVFLFHTDSLYICNNTTKTKSVIAVFGLTVFSRVKENEVSLWIERACPEKIKEDWYFRGGGGPIIEMCGGNPPKSRYIYGLFNMRNKEGSNTYLKKVIAVEGSIPSELEKELDVFLELQEE